MNYQNNTEDLLINLLNSKNTNNNKPKRANYIEKLREKKEQLVIGQNNQIIKLNNK